MKQLLVMIALALLVAGCGGLAWGGDFVVSNQIDLADIASRLDQVEKVLKKQTPRGELAWGEECYEEPKHVFMSYNLKTATFSSGATINDVVKAVSLKGFTLINIQKRWEPQYRDEYLLYDLWFKRRVCP